MHTRILVCTAALAAMTAAPAMANTLVVDISIPVTGIVAGQNGFTGGVSGTPPFAPGFSVDLAEGDTFDLTMHFTGIQPLTLNNVGFIWAFSYADLSTDVTGTGSLALLDQNGAALFTSNPKTDTEGVAHFGQFFFASDFVGLPASVAFYGIHYVGTVDNYVDPTITTRNYNNPAFFFNADSFTPAVPEPAGWALMLAGLGLFGALVKRRR